MPAELRTLGPRDRETAATRRAILRAGESLLAKGGEAGLSIRELCARAGVTAPTVYHHFGDKQRLVERIVDDRFLEFDRTIAAAPPTGDPVEALRRGFEQYVAYGRAHPEHYRLIFGRARRTPAGLAAYDRLRRMVQALADAGRLGPDVEDATAACWAAVHGVTALVVAGFLTPDAPAVALTRDAIIRQLTTTRGRRRRRKEAPDARA
jgi:AcrR family transcriptional regulator